MAHVPIFLCSAVLIQILILTAEETDVDLHNNLGSFTDTRNTGLTIKISIVVIFLHNSTFFNQVQKIISVRWHHSNLKTS